MNASQEVDPIYNNVEALIAIIKTSVLESKLKALEVMFEHFLAMKNHNEHGILFIHERNNCA